MGTRRTVLQQYYIKAPSAKVFKAISDNKELTRWFLSKARLDKEKGGEYKFTWQGGYTESGKVLEYVPGKKLSLSWPSIWKKKLLGRTRAAFTVETRGKGTLLRLRHSGWGTSEGWIWNYALTHAGWSYYLTNLKSVLERGYDLRSRLDRQS